MTPNEPDPYIPMELAELRETVARLAVVVGRVADTPPPAPVAPQAPSQTGEVLLMAFTGLGYALSARALLLLALVGAFVLAIFAVERGTGMSLGVLVAYMLGTVVPVTVLEIRKVLQ